MTSTVGDRHVSSVLSHISESQSHLLRLIELVLGKEIKKPRISDEDVITEKLASQVVSEIKEVVESKRYFNEVIEKELTKLLDSLSNNEPAIAKKVYVTLQTKYPELIKNYQLKENRQ